MKDFILPERFLLSLQKTKILNPWVSSTQPWLFSNQQCEFVGVAPTTVKWSLPKSAVMSSPGQIGNSHKFDRILRYKI
jgi:hypothetical protein